MAGIAVGIDLGTTFSAIAYVNRHGVPEVLPNAEGEQITPSVILFEKDAPIVGTYAKQAAAVYPDSVVEFVKREMGNDQYRFNLRDEEFTAQQLSSFVLAKLKEDAEQRLGQPVTDAVITVPAYFNDIQRRKTLEAGKLAGLNVLKLLNEPTAAAFAYGLNHASSRRKVLVFDLGGGTFDVTLVQMADQEIAVIATDGDHALGGKDWDDRVIDHVAKQFQDKHGTDPRTDLASLHDLRAKCVSAKISLTRRPKVNIFHDFEEQVLRVSLTRDEFEGLTSDLLARCRDLTQAVLTAANTAASEIDTVLLAGGSTRMPMVRQMLTDVFDKPPGADINPDEAVALGAALTATMEAARREGKESAIDIRTHDVTSHSLGMVALKNGQLHNSKIISRNTRIPAEHSREDYATTRDGQTSMDMWLVQGEKDDPRECVVLGHFEFYGIPPRPAGATRLSITFRYNANAIVEVEAMDLASGQILPYRIASDALRLEDIAENRAPVHFAFLLDCSGSMYGQRMEEQKKRAKWLARKALAGANRRVAVVSYPGGVRSHLTNRAEEIDKAIDSLVPVGGSPMRRAMELARASVRQEPGVARVFVVMGDGKPDDPKGTHGESETVRGTGARVVTVGIDQEASKDFLRSIASSPSDYHDDVKEIALDQSVVNLATQLETGA